MSIMICMICIPENTLVNQTYYTIQITAVNMPKAYTLSTMRRGFFWLFQSLVTIVHRELRYSHPGFYRGGNWHTGNCHGCHKAETTTPQHLRFKSCCSSHLRFFQSASLAVQHNGRGNLSHRSFLKSWEQRQRFYLVLNAQCIHSLLKILKAWSLKK